VIAKYGFPANMRLHKTDEFSSVFNFRCSLGGIYLQVLAKPNDLGNARLGIIVSRKISKRAVDRNYIKRAIREYFRLNQREFDNLDVVVRVRKLFTSTTLTVIHRELAQHISGLKKCRAFSSS